MLSNYSTSKKTILLIIGIGLIVCISSLVLSQGGYYATATAVAGLFIALLCIIGIVAKIFGWLPQLSENRIKRHAVQIFCFALLVLCYVISLFTNGITISSLSAFLPWIVALATLFLTILLPFDLRILMKKVLCYIGIAFAIFGLFICSGSISLTGTFVDNRLYFTFQYANATGIFFLVITLLYLLSSDVRLSKAWIVPAVALLRTQSMASIGIFLLVVIVYSIILLIRKDYSRTCQLFIGILLVFILFGLALIIKDSYAFVPFLLTIAAWILFNILCSRLENKGSFVACMILIAILLVSIFAVALLISGRLEEASRTIIVRLMQNIDAIKIILSSPIIGTGPDSWNYLYPNVQSAQYSVSVVHNSFAQIAVEAGLIALVCFLAFIILGIVDIISINNEKAFGSKLCSLFPVLAFLLHCMVDFDLCYSSLLLLLVVMLSPLCVEPEGDSCLDINPHSFAPLTFSQKISFVIAASVVTLSCGCFCIFELNASSVLQQYDKALKSADSKSVTEQFLGNPLLANDPSMQEKYLQTLFNSGQNEQIIEWCNQKEYLTGMQSMYLARAYYEQGNIAKAEDVIADILSKYPFQYALFEEAHRIVSKYDSAYYVSARYQNLLENANNLTHQDYSSLLFDQKDVRGA